MVRLQQIKWGFVFYGKLTCLALSYLIVSFGFLFKKYISRPTLSDEPLEYFRTRNLITQDLEDNFGFQLVSLDKKPSFMGYIDPTHQLAKFKAPEYSFIDELQVQLFIAEDKKSFSAARLKTISLKNKLVSKKELLKFIKAFSNIVFSRTNSKSFKKTVSFGYPFSDYHVCRLIFLFLFLNKESIAVFNKAKGRVIDLELGSILFNWDEFSTNYSLTVSLNNYCLSHVPGNRATYTGLSFSNEVSISRCSVPGANLSAFIEENIARFESY